MGFELGNQAGGLGQRENLPVMMIFLVVCHGLALCGGTGLLRVFHHLSQLPLSRNQGCLRKVKFFNHPFEIPPFKRLEGAST